MKRITEFSQIPLIPIFLSSCVNSINKEYSIINLEENINEINNYKKKIMKIKFSCV